MNKTILVTGGMGYIGTHTVIRLIENNYKITILDNLSNSNFNAKSRCEEIVKSKIQFVQADMLDSLTLNTLLSKQKFSSVIHFAGLKSVGEGEIEPLKYFQNNVSGTINLLSAMESNGVSNLIFSSSATIYGDPGYAKCTEQTPPTPSSIYGKTKYLGEEIIRDYAKTNSSFNFGILRYFNPVGAHESGLIGEDPKGTPNNLMPFLSQVAIGKHAKVSIWGNDYPTPDGTGRRDYIHVEDLAQGHLAALDALESGIDSFTVNLGTGNSYSVLEVIAAFEKASGKKIPYEFSPRRPGDVAENYADPTLARELLGWSAKLDLDRMCEDAWRWQSQNPNGYL